MNIQVIIDAAFCKIKTVTSIYFPLGSALFVVKN